MLSSDEGPLRDHPHVGSSGVSTLRGSGKEGGVRGPRIPPRVPHVWSWSRQALLKGGHGWGRPGRRKVQVPAGGTRASGLTLAERLERRVWWDSPGWAAWAWALAPLVLVGMQVKLRMAPRRLATRARKAGHWILGATIMVTRGSGPRVQVSPAASPPLHLQSLRPRLLRTAHTHSL